MNDRFTAEIAENAEIFGIQKAKKKIS